MLAKIQGVFRLTRDLTLTYLQDGTAIAKLGLACSEKFKEKETQLFLDASIFGKAAEILNQFAGAKGTQIFLTGKLKTDQWEKDGQKYSKTIMIIEDFQFLGSKPQHTNEQQSQPQNYNQPKHTDYQPKEQARQMPDKNSLPEIDIDESMIPF